MNIITKGAAAELMVAGYLRKKGCIISKMNYHSRFGEIDIVAETHKHIIFVEVKLRKEGSMVSGAEAVDAAKRQKIRVTAMDYLRKAHLDELQPRFDVAVVTEKVLPNGEKQFKIEYIKNAF